MLNNKNFIKIIKSLIKERRNLINKKKTKNFNKRQ